MDNSISIHHGALHHRSTLEEMFQRTLFQYSQKNLKDPNYYFSHFFWLYYTMFMYLLLIINHVNFSIL